MFLNQRIFELLKIQGKTAVELASYIGISSASVSAWKNEGSFPSSKYIEKISEFLNVSNHYLITGIQDNVQSDPQYLSEDEIVNGYRSLDDSGKSVVSSVLTYTLDKAQTKADKQESKVMKLPKDKQKRRGLPYYDIPVSAGFGNHLDEAEYKLVEIPAQEVPENTNFIVRIDGDSMEPEFQDGDAVFVHQTTAVDVGDIGIFLLDGKALCKKLIQKSTGHYLLSLNPKYDPIPLEDGMEIHTLGKVLGKSKI